MNQALLPFLRPREEPAFGLEVRRISNDERSAGSRIESTELTLLRKRLESAVRAVCPFWLRDHQQDIVQVAMMAVLRQQAKSEGKRQFPSSYLRKAAYSAMVDEIRRRRSRGEVPLETAEVELTLIDGGADPEDHCSAGEIALGVRECLARLAPRRCTAVTLHLLGYSVPRIAEKTGWKRKRAENLVYKEWKICVNASEREVSSHEHRCE